MADEAPVTYETENGIGIITLNRPKYLNALDFDAMQVLHQSLLKAGGDPSIRVVMVTGAGRAFCAGGDVKNMLSRALAGTHGTPAELARMGAGLLHSCINELRALEKPVVSVINGVCAGAGMGLALAADIVWAAESASFNLAYTKIGLSPDGGTTYLLPRVVGEKMAMELLLTCRDVDSAEALKIGLVSRVIADDKLMEEAKAMCTKLASGATLAFGVAKQLVSQSLHNSLPQHLEQETRGIVKSIQSKDFMEGVTAFMEKRAPEFKNR